MKAIRVHQFGPPEVMRLEDLPALRPGNGQVLVRVKAAGVNPVETYIRSGNYARLPALPFTPGNDAAGIVEAIGTGVNRVVVGDRVFVAGSLSGTYAEQTLCNETQIHRLPERASFSQGAALGVPCATAAHALWNKAAARTGETVFVHGASGAVGIAAVQLAKAAGCQVIGTAGTEQGREVVREQGVEHVLDHHVPDYLAKLMTLTGGRGVDVILEMLANVNLGKDLPVLAPRGRVVVIGSRGAVEINPRDLMARDASITGMILFNVPAAELAEIYTKLSAMLEAGSLRPVVGREFPLVEAPQAHSAVMTAGACGKIVLVP